MNSYDPKMERIAVLQAVRAVAALAVLLHHAGHTAHKYGGPLPFLDITRMARFGVDLFFVLSGFIILYATVGRGLSLRSYGWARIRRIFLPYWPVGIVMAIGTYGLLPDTLGALRGWVTSLSLLPIGKPGLIVAWTLQHELVFYTLVAIGLWSGWWRSLFALWGGAILFFWITGLTAPIGAQPIDAEFLMGAAAWAAWRSGQQRTIVALGIALILLALALALGGMAAGLERAAPMAIAALFAALLPWLVRGEQSGHIRVSRPLLFLGDASYAIYLVHALPLPMLAEPLAGYGWQVILPAGLLGGLAAGIAYHVAVERPVLAFAKRFKFGQD